MENEIRVRKKKFIFSNADDKPPKLKVTKHSFKENPFEEEEKKDIW